MPRCYERNQDIISDHVEGREKKKGEKKVVVAADRVGTIVWDLRARITSFNRVEFLPSCPEVKPLHTNVSKSIPYHPTN